MESQLKQITKANGYNTDLGNSIYYWYEGKAIQYEKDAIIYRDRAHRFQKKNLYYEHSLDCEIQALLFQSEAISEVLQDILSAIAIDYTWDKTATNTDVTDARTEMGVYGKQILSLTVSLSTTYRSPFFTV